MSNHQDIKLMICVDL